MPAPVQATTTRPLPNDQSILLYGMALVFASVTIPFWSYIDSMCMRFSLKLNAREIRSFLPAVEEAERRNARLNGVRRWQHRGDSDDEENNDNDDADESDSEALPASNLVSTSCRQCDYTDLDDESSGSDSEEPLSGIAQVSSVSEQRGIRSVSADAGFDSVCKHDHDHDPWTWSPKVEIRSS
ncbi:MAG: hypothetical protein Q9175_000069 [Cornicularia normoerica]